MNGPAQQFGLTSVLLLIIILVIGISEQVLLAALQIWTVLFFVTGFICEKELRLVPGAGRPSITRSAAARATSGSRNVQISNLLEVLRGSTSFGSGGTDMPGRKI
jgi:hypothetical protein